MQRWLPPERSEYGPFNRRPRRPVPMHADDHWLHATWYELPRGDPAFPEVYIYSNAMSYAPGEEIRFHVSCSAPTWSLQVYRDGAQPNLVHSADDLHAAFAPAPQTGTSLAATGRSATLGASRQTRDPASTALSPFARAQTERASFSTTSSSCAQLPAQRPAAC